MLWLGRQARREMANRVQFVKISDEVGLEPTLEERLRKNKVVDKDRLHGLGMRFYKDEIKRYEELNNLYAFYHKHSQAMGTTFDIFLLILATAYANTTDAADAAKLAIISQLEILYYVKDSKESPRDDDWYNKRDLFYYEMTGMRITEDRRLETKRVQDRKRRLEEIRERHHETHWKDAKLDELAVLVIIEQCREAVISQMAPLFLKNIHIRAVMDPKIEQVVMQIMSENPHMPDPPADDMIEIDGSDDDDDSDGSDDEHSFFQIAYTAVTEATRGQAEQPFETILRLAARSARMTDLELEILPADFRLMRKFSGEILAKSERKVPSNIDADNNANAPIVLGLIKKFSDGYESYLKLAKLIDTVIVRDMEAPNRPDLIDVNLMSAAMTFQELTNHNIFTLAYFLPEEADKVMEALMEHYSPIMEEAEDEEGSDDGSSFDSDLEVQVEDDDQEERLDQIVDNEKEDDEESEELSEFEKAMTDAEKEEEKRIVKMPKRTKTPREKREDAIPVDSTQIRKPRTRTPSLSKTRGARQVIRPEALAEKEVFWENFLYCMSNYGLDLITSPPTAVKTADDFFTEYAYCVLGCTREENQRAQIEIRDLVAGHYSGITSDRADPTQSLFKQYANLAGEADNSAFVDARNAFREEYPRTREWVGDVIGFIYLFQLIQKVHWEKDECRFEPGFHYYRLFYLGFYKGLVHPRVRNGVPLELAPQSTQKEVRKQFHRLGMVRDQATDKGVAYLLGKPGLTETEQFWYLLSEREREGFKSFARRLSVDYKKQFGADDAWWINRQAGGRYPAWTTPEDMYFKCRTFMPGNAAEARTIAEASHAVSMWYRLLVRLEWISDMPAAVRTRCIEMSKLPYCRLLETNAVYDRIVDSLITRWSETTEEIFKAAKIIMKEMLAYCDLPATGEDEGMHNKRRHHSNAFIFAGVDVVTHVLSAIATNEAMSKAGPPFDFVEENDANADVVMTDVEAESERKRGRDVDSDEDDLEKDSKKARFRNLPRNRFQ